MQQATLEFQMLCGRMLPDLSEIFIFSNILNNFLSLSKSEHF